MGVHAESLDSHVSVFVVWRISYFRNCEGVGLALSAFGLRYLGFGLLASTLARSDFHFHVGSQIRSMSYLRVMLSGCGCRDLEFGGV